METLDLEFTLNSITEYKNLKGEKMNKQVLIISASPRKNGNSDTLCNEFLRGAIDGGNQAEKIFLKDKKINYCTGCGACVNKKGNCSQKNDDMFEILNKMITADVIVMATPIYFYTMCGQLKTFIDRTCSHYTEIKNKDFYFIMTAADTSETAMDRTIEEFKGFTYCLEGAKEKDFICATGVWNIGDIKSNPIINKAYELGKKI